jgi:quercetin dioxygenase-like cupin family protein
MLPLALLLFFQAADPRVKIDNDSVRVLSVVDEPHHPSALHRHDLNRVMIYLTDGNLMVRYQDGKVDNQHWKAGQVAWSAAGGMHISENAGSTPLRIIEVELKKPGSKAPVRKRELDPIAIDPSHNVLLFQNDQVRVFRSIREAGGTEMMHEHLGAGRVGVYLTELNAPDAHYAAGDVSWSGPLKHATKNLGPNKLEMIVVEVF